MNLNFTKKAIEDLEEIYHFLEQKNENAAVYLHNYILDEIERLKTFPQMAPIEPLLADCSETFRSLIIRKIHKVIYYIEDETVNIVSIWDCRQNPDTMRNNINFLL
ncbi:MAG: type II toxin-antitoxin system RelE/ParE family toxin [Tannerella sp.]|jgi:plasmid stabilization system protein ParE|nr:type II toxin-antitoxin system RelE/ParE family toxin [Tannerella sp.]